MQVWMEIWRNQIPSVLLKYSASTDSPLKEFRPPLRQAAQPYVSPLKDPIAGTSWKSISNWEQLAGANGGLEWLVSSSPRNPYLTCIYKELLQERENGLTHNPVQTHPIPDSKSNSHPTVTVRNCRKSGKHMMKKIDWRKKTGLGTELVKEASCQDQSSKGSMFFLYFGKHGSAYDSAIYHSDECSTAALLTTYYIQTGPITVSFLLWGTKL